MENLKKQLIESWKGFEIRFLESHAFNNLKEKYQSLNRRQQKGLKYLFFLLFFSALVYLPLSYFVSSVFHWGAIKEKQNISARLLKMRGRISSSIFRYPPLQLKEKIKRLAKKYSNNDVELKDKRVLFASSDSIYQISYTVRLNHLNIKQATRLGAEFHSLSQVRLDSLFMEESASYPKHYDVSYNLLAFAEKEKALKKTFKRREKRKRKPKALKNKDAFNLKKDKAQTSNKGLPGR